MGHEGDPDFRQRFERKARAISGNIMLTKSEAKLLDFGTWNRSLARSETGNGGNGPANRRRVPPSTEGLVRLSFGPGSMTAAQKCEGHFPGASQHLAEFQQLRRHFHTTVSLTCFLSEPSIPLGVVP